MPRTSHNSHILSHGGDRTHLYPHATGWEGMGAAIKRSGKTTDLNSDPIHTAKRLLASLRGRYSSLFQENGSKMKTKDTRTRVQDLIGKIQTIPDSEYIKGNLSNELNTLIEQFEKKGHKIVRDHA